MDDLPKMFTNRRRAFGGCFFVPGGQLYLQGCTFLRFRPFGNPILDSMVVGRDVLIIAGNLVLSGCYNLNGNLFANNVVAGNVLAVLGGTAVWAGGTLANVAGAQAQWGAGIQMFVGGGVLVSAGFAYLSCNGALMRGSFGLFAVGAGVHIQTGYMQTRAWATGSINNAGQTFSIGAGIHQMVGGAMATTSIANVFFGAGGTSFVGSGQMRWIGVAQARSAVAQSQYGVGLVLYNGAGTVNVIYVAQCSAQVVRAQFAAGNDIFLGAGWMTSINTTRYGAQVASSFHGTGNQIFIGGGGAVFIRCYTVTFRRIGYSSTANLYTIAGTGVSRSQGQKNIVVTKAGISFLPWQPSPRPKRTLVDGEDGIGEMDDLVDDAQSAFFSPDGKSKLVVIQSQLEEGTQVVVEDPTPFEAKELKDAWGGLAKLLADGVIPQGQGKALDTSKGTIFVNNTNCFICSVGPGGAAEHVDGPSSCVVSDACSDADSPATAFAAAKDAAAAVATGTGEEAFDLSFPGMKTSLPDKLAKGEVELPDVWMLWHEMTVYCHTTDLTMDAQALSDAGCLSEQYVKDVVRAYMGPDFGRDDYQLAVSSTKVHDAVKPLVDEPLAQAMTPEWNPDCEGWTTYNIYITTNDPAMEDALLKEWNAIVAEPADLETTLLQNADGDGNNHAAIKPCAMALKRLGVAKYPSFKNMRGFKPLSSGNSMSLAGPSVTVASDSAIAPVTEVMAGETYKLYVQNFMKGNNVNVNLIEGLGKTGPAVTTLRDFNDDAKVAEVEWTVPTGLVEGKKYYLRAAVEALPALYANSQAFTFVGA